MPETVRELSYPDHHTAPDSRESRAGPSWKEDPLWLPRTWMLEDGGEHGAQ